MSHTPKNCKVVMLPTEGKSHICFLTAKGKEWNDLRYSNIECPIILDSENQHLYVLSDDVDDIQKYDWVLNPKHNSVYQWIENADKTFDRIDARKIMATTDKSLGLPVLDYDFIQNYVEQYRIGNVITSVIS